MSGVLFVQKPITGGATMNAQNTALDGSGSSGTTIWPLLAFTGGPSNNGGYLDYIQFKPLVTLSADTVCRVFVSNDGSLGAPHCRLVGELLITVASGTVGSSVATNDANLRWYPAVGMGEIAQGSTIFVAESQASTISAFAAGGLF